MEHIDFILWMVLYPIGCALRSLIAAKERKLHNLEPHPGGTKSLSALIDLVIWISIAKALF
jgi:hypothetical protein